MNTGEGPTFPPRPARSDVEEAIARTRAHWSAHVNELNDEIYRLNRTVHQLRSVADEERRRRDLLEQLRNDGEPNRFANWLTQALARQGVTLDMAHFLHSYEEGG